MGRVFAVAVIALTTLILTFSTSCVNKQEACNKARVAAHGAWTVVETKITARAHEFKERYNSAVSAYMRAPGMNLPLLRLRDAAYYQLGRFQNRYGQFGDGLALKVTNGGALAAREAAVAVATTLRGMTTDAVFDVEDVDKALSASNASFEACKDVQP